MKIQTKLSLVLVVFIFFSCEGKKDILLPKSNRTVLSNVGEHSPIYLFFKTNEKDTLVDLNRKNAITSTHWIFNIDKRLPMYLVVPKLQFLQGKKEGSMHKNQTSQNYFSYADSLHKNLAFIPFTKVIYKLQRPKSGHVIFFTKKNQILINGSVIERIELKSSLATMDSDKSMKLILCFDRNATFSSYLQNKIFLEGLQINASRVGVEEFVY